MHIAKGWLLAGFLFFGGLVCLWLAGCDDDNPTKPVDPGPRDYVFYWNRNGYDSAFFGYHTLTGKIDSFNLPAAEIHDMNVSADGQRVYISYKDNTKVVRATDFSTLLDIQYSGWYGIAVSPDNHHIAVQSGNLRILSTCDYSVVFQDTIAVRRSVFSTDGSCLYGIGPDSLCPSVYQLDLKHGFKSRLICPPDTYPIWRVVPSRDRKWLFMFRHIYNSYMYLDVYDREGDSLIFRDLVAPGYGDMAVSPDNKYLYFTGPGNIFDWPPVSYSFARYSIREHKIDSFIVAGSCIFGEPTGVMGSDLAMTPDGRYLAISDKDPHNWFLVYDCLIGDTVTSICLSNVEFWYLTCQNGR